MRFGLGEIKISHYRSDYRFHKVIQRAKAAVALADTVKRLNHGNVYTPMAKVQRHSQAMADRSEQVAKTDGVAAF